MPRRIVIIATGALIVITLIAIGIFYALRGRQLVLNSTPSLSQVTVNGQSLSFQQGTAIAFDHTVTIQASLNGYKDFYATLDPHTYQGSSYTIKLVSDLVDSSGRSATDILLQAARDNGTNLGLLDTNGQPTAVVISTKDFSDNYTMYTIQPINNQDTGGTALVILQKRSDGYHIILGPGTDFQASDFVGLPSDLTNYYQRRIGSQ